MRIISGKARGTKLYTLEGKTTRPTLDRVKESLFSIIQPQIEESIFLDLFSGSGAIGLEAASRGAKKAILCEKERNAVNIIKKNIEKTHLEENTTLYALPFEKVVEEKLEEKANIVYIDPPYKTNLVKKAIELLLKHNKLEQDAILIIETDEEERIKKEIQNLKIKIIDQRKYGRAHLIFIQKQDD